MAPADGVGDNFNFSLDNGELQRMVQEALYNKEGCYCFWEPVRPIPECDYWFENVWNEYRRGTV